MIESRRTFLKKASLLAGATAAFQMLPTSIQQALAIDAPEGSTYLDAEHIVFLMQENRSFDHCYGTLRGVRGFNDPRAMKMHNGLPVWIQTNAQGDSYAPFHLDIENTKATWMGSLPHGWKDMVAARHDGKMDTWLEAKKAGNPNYQHMPLTMGYYDRRDLPFYYAFADAFTVCDQHFCSSLTGTSANRSYFWAGAIREQPHDPDSVAHVDNGQINYKDVGWTTYPERLEHAGVEWKVYQNELSLPVGLNREEEDWLANFTDNNLEFYGRYQVRYHAAHHRYMQREADQIRKRLSEGSAPDGGQREKLELRLKHLQEDIVRFNNESFETLDPFTKNIHRKAFVTNHEDPYYHQLENIDYSDAGGEKSVSVPKGDVFYQFRQDVKEDKLPTVSWLVAPCRFSDHPGSPWYGAWYVSEALDILTANPEIWKKTIFVLTYDENDGYFDHVSPFVPPHSARPHSGAVPREIKTEEEYVTAEQEKIRTGNPETTLDSPIGLGFRVPMVVASPWTKGGWVNSEVFDHTSTLQFLEHFIEKKFGKQVVESNISAWRRLVCGDLTSVFRPVKASDKINLQSIDRNDYVKRIFSAGDKDLPGNYQLISKEDLKGGLVGGLDSPIIPKQEKGTKPACPLPYDVDVNAFVDVEQQELVIKFSVNGKLPSNKIVGVPFIASATNPYEDENNVAGIWNFTVGPKEPLVYRWKLSAFKTGQYDIAIYGPNGFYRSFKGNCINAIIGCGLVTQNIGSEGIRIDLTGYAGKWTVTDLSYGYGVLTDRKSALSVIELNLTRSNGWYDVAVKSDDRENEVYQFAGHVEIGKPSVTDPLMGFGKGRLSS